MRNGGDVTGAAGGSVQTMTAEVWQETHFVAAKGLVQWAECTWG